MAIETELKKVVKIKVNTEAAAGARPFVVLFDEDGDLQFYCHRTDEYLYVRRADIPAFMAALTDMVS